MFAARSLAPRRPGVGPALASPIASAVLLVLTLALAPSPRVSAQSIADAPAVLPFADVLSASSWLLVSGQDPRYAALPIGVAWTSTASATPGAAFGRESSGASNQNPLITRSLGLTPVNADPALAVDPRNPDHLILAVTALDLPSIATYSSNDGGATWDGPVQAPYVPGDEGATGSPAVAFGRDGTAFLAMQSVKLGDQAAFDGRRAIDRSRITVSRSDDGASWGEPVTVAVATREAQATVDETGLAATDIATPFLDRPALAVGSDPEQPDREVIYVAYTELVARTSRSAGEGGSTPAPPTTETTIRLVRSADGGQSWNDPIAISPTVTRMAPGEAALAPSPGPLDPAAPQPAPAPAPPVSPIAGEAGQVVQGTQIGVMADGAVVATYLDSTEDGPHQGLARVMTAISTDGGRSFTESVQAGLFHEVLPRPRRSFVHWWGTSFPRLALGDDGEIAIAVTARPTNRTGDDADLLLLRSLDRGSTWAPPVSIGGDETDAAQFFPALMVTPDGALTAVWADTRGDPSGVRYGIYGAVSTDNGDTWQPITSADEANAGLISDDSSNLLAGAPGGRYLGDRLAVATSPDGVYVAWPDTRLATPGATNLQIAFARLRP